MFLDKAFQKDRTFFVYILRCVENKDALGRKRRKKRDESLFGWFFRRPFDAFIYAKIILENQRTFLGNI